MVLALGTLAVRVRSNIGIIRAGVNQGLTSNAIQQLIRSTGQPGLRRVDLLAGIRHASGIAESGVRIQNIRLDRFPDPARIESARGPMVSNFSYDVRVGVRLNPDGSFNRRHLTIRSERNLTPQQIVDEAERALAEAPELARYGRIREEETLTVVGARRKR